MVSSPLLLNTTGRIVRVKRNDTYLGNTFIVSIPEMIQGKGNNRTRFP